MKVMMAALQTLRTLHFDALSFSADDLLHLCLDIFLEVINLRCTAFIMLQILYCVERFFFEILRRYY